MVTFPERKEAHSCTPLLLTERKAVTHERYRVKELHRGWDRYSLHFPFRLRGPGLTQVLMAAMLTNPLSWGSLFDGEVGLLIGLCSFSFGRLSVRTLYTQL